MTNYDLQFIEPREAGVGSIKPLRARITPPPADHARRRRAGDSTKNFRREFWWILKIYF